MTARYATAWDIDVWPFHAYVTHATREDADLFALRMSREVGEVAIYELDPTDDSTTGRTDMPIPGTETALEATNAPSRVYPVIRGGESA